MLTHWDALKSYFASDFDLSDDEENDNTKSREER